MHEFGVALEIGRLVEAQAAPLPAGAVTAVGLEVGDRAGVEPANLQFCLEAVFGGPPFARVALVLDRTDGPDVRLTWVEVDDEHPAH